MGACRVEAESRVVGLGENGVGGAGDEVGEEDGRLAGVDEETAHGRPPFGMEVDGKMDDWIGTYALCKVRNLLDDACVVEWEKRQ